MSFLSPAWLLLLLLAGVIAFLHSRPRRDVEVPSVLLWRDSANLAPPRASRKLPVPNLLMLLQLLVVAAIALGLARPVLNRPGEQVDHWIVLLDASGSMQAVTDGTTPFAEARGYLAAELGREDFTGRRVSLVRVASRSSVVGARLPRPEQAREALEGVEASHATAAWGEAAARLPGLLVEGERTRVTILSDPAGASEARTLVAEVLPDTTIEAFAFGRPTGNRALAGVTPTLLDAAAGRWRISGEVRAFPGGDEVAAPGAAVPLRVFFEPVGMEGAIEWAAIEVGVGGADAAPFEVDVALPGAGVLEVRLAEDELPHDDRVRFVLHGTPLPARVLYVGAGNPPLERALEAVPGVEITRTTAVPASAADYDLVILDRVAAPRGLGTNTMWLGVSPDGGAAPRLADPAPTGWLEDHPLARSIDWSALSVQTAAQLPRLPGAEVLLESADGPLVQARTTRDGREVVVAFVLGDSNWPDLLAFPAFVANLVRWTVPDVGSALATSCHAGLPCPLEPGELTGGATVVGPDSHRTLLPSFGLASDAGAAGASPHPRTLEAGFVPERSGVYTIETDGGRRTVAVNALFESEGNLAQASGADSALRPGEPQSVPAARVWLLLLAIAALCAETWIARQRGERSFRAAGLARTDPHSGRRRLTLALRAAELGLLLLALLNVPGLYPIRGSDVVLVADDPGAEATDAGVAARSFLASADEEASRLRRVGLVGIGPEGRVASDLGAALEPADSLRPPAPGADLEAALDLAGGLLPPESAGRIVLVSDGSETRGTVAAALPRLLARGIPIDVYRLPGRGTADVSVEDVSVPGTVRPSEVATLHGVVASPGRVTGTARLLRDGVVHTERPVELFPGQNRVEFDVSEEAAGVHLYEVEVEVEGDGFVGNNRGGRLVEVLEAPRVAIVTPQPGWGRSLADALAVQGLAAEVMTPDRALAASADGSGLSLGTNVDVLVLMNVPVSDMPESGLAALETWVRDSGGGLVVLGGENTFGPGGYFDTPLESISPLSSRIPQELPNLAIVFVLDRSGSMSTPVGGGTRLDVGKRATLEAIELLDPETLVGVVAFDLGAQLIVPIQPAGDFPAIRDRLENLGTGGGTRMLSGLGLAYSALYQVDPEFRRHIVVMTDGRSIAGNYRGLMQAVVEAGMTVSGAAIGEGADVALVQQLARMGGGAAHVTRDFSDFPSILAREATRFSSGAVREDLLTPTWRDREASFLESLPDTPPALRGYVRTTLKPGARLHLEGPDDVPVLASWRYGLGRVVAFASHGAGPWAADWMASPDYALWWAQIVRSAVPAGAGPGLHVRVARDRDYGRMVVEAVHPDGRAHRGLELEATIAAPTEPGAAQTALLETRPGVYEGSFIADQPGSYAVSVSSRGAEESAVEPVRARLHVAYPAQYEQRPSDADLLPVLARLSGGRMLEEGERIFADSAPTRWVLRPMWPLWAFLALALFMVEIWRRYGSTVPRLRPRLRRDR